MPIGVGTAIQIAGAASSLFGGRDKAGSAQSAAIAASNKASAAAQRTRDFFGSQFKRNRSLYGRIERDRVRAAEKLNVEGLTAQGLQNVRQGFQKRAERVKQSAALRGVESSGLTAQQEFNLGIEQAEAEAQVRYDAPLQALQIQTQALQPGLQREAQLNQGISASTGQLVNAHSRTAALQAGFAESAAEQQGAGLSELLSAAGGIKGGDISSFISSLSKGKK